MNETKKVAPDAGATHVALHRLLAMRGEGAIEP